MYRLECRRGCANNDGTSFFYYLLFKNVFPINSIVSYYFYCISVQYFVHERNLRPSLVKTKIRIPLDFNKVEKSGRLHCYSDEKSEEETEVKISS